MRILVRFALSIGAAVLFAACGGAQPPIGTPSALLQTSPLAARTNRAHYKACIALAEPAMVAFPVQA